VPILVRPVREQLEHDRVIRYLQAKLKRKFDVTTNIGEEQNVGVRSGNLTLYPDLVLSAGRKIAGVIEVETNESVNHLEAMAQWAHFGRSRVPFHLYVPAGSVEMARRLAEENQAAFSEIWSYHAIGEQIRFTMVHRAAAPPAVKPVRAAAPRRKSAAPASRAAKSRGTSSRGKVSRSARAGGRASGRPARKATARAQKRK
jgi:hypothetical protein